MCWCFGVLSKFFLGLTGQTKAWITENYCMAFFGFGLGGFQKLDLGEHRPFGSLKSVPSEVNNSDTHFGTRRWRLLDCLVSMRCVYLV